MSRFASGTGALLLVSGLFFASPSPAHAIFGIGGGVGGGQTVVEVGPQLQQTTISALKETISSIANVSSAASQSALVVNKYVLEPLAFAVSGNMLKSITASVVDFVSGKTNGTGAPQFVQNLQGHMQLVGDVQALSFLSNFSQQSNSPFAGAIASSLRTNYLQETSEEGFFAANQCTLDEVSSNPEAFLSGDWSQGGLGAWFALTTRQENNPYALQANAKRALEGRVAGAQDARRNELNWGDGFLSWCGGNSETGDLSVAGVACVNPDGSPGSILTPGSIIGAQVNKALNIPIDRLIGVGNISPEINSILGDISVAMNTVNFASQILGSGNSFGLAGSGSVSSPLSRYRNDDGYLGVSQASVFRSAASIPASGSELLNRVGLFEASWNTIGGAADAAASDANALAAYCAAEIDKAEKQILGNFEQSSNTLLQQFITEAKAIRASALGAVTGQIAAVQTQASSARTQSAAARSQVQKVQTSLQSNTTTQEAYLADVNLLQTMPPSFEDVAVAEQESTVFNAAGPADSMSVSGGSLVDQMRQLSANAQSLRTKCTMPSPGAQGALSS